jgi:uncharacterized protein YbcC (UPF0753/DUF2309 family)
MKIELTEAELSTILGALNIADHETCADRYDKLADVLRERRDKAKEIANKKSLDWSGGDL